MTLPLVSFGVIALLTLLSKQVINAKNVTICEALERNDSSIDYGLTYYNTNKKSYRYCIFVSNEFWDLNVNAIDSSVNGVFGIYNSSGSQAIGLTYDDANQIKFTIINNSIECSLISFDGNAFKYLRVRNYTVKFIRRLGYKFCDFNPLLAFIPSSFRSNSKNYNTVIFVEQNRVNDTFKRRYKVMRFEYKYNIDITHGFDIIEDKSAVIPKFLNALPNDYEIKGVLDHTSVNNEHNIILLINDNGIPKYCVTPEETLSIQCQNKNNFKTYVDCELNSISKFFNAESNSTTTESKSKGNSNIVLIVAIVIVIVVVLVILCLCCYCYDTTPSAPVVANQLRTSNTPNTNTAIISNTTSATRCSSLLIESNKNSSMISSHSTANTKSRSNLFIGSKSLLASKK